MKLGTIVLLLGTLGWAQPTDGPEQFEAAAVKISIGGGGGLVGGPGTIYPTRLSYNAVSLRMVMQRAFSISYYRILGPDWLNEQRYAITATVPEGTTHTQVNTMLQNLLVERFHLKFRREKRELPVYQLVVDKAGPKMALSKSQGGSSIGPLSRPQPQGIEIDALWGASMSGLASALSMGVVHDLIEDKTGLTGKYDYKLQIATEPGSQGGGQAYSSLTAALSDLGLKLIRVKGSVDVLVVESGDRNPAEN